MRIGVDASCWSNRRGFGRFTRCLLHELAPLALARGHRLVLVADRATLTDPDLPPGVELVPVDLSVPATEAAAAGGSRSVRDMIRMTRAALGVHADVFFFPATYSYVPVPRTPVVVTAHDAIAESLPDLVVPARLDRWRWAAKQRLALRRAALVLTVSEAAKNDVVTTLHVSSERVRVVAEAADPRFVSDGGGTHAPSCIAAVDGRPYLLYVGGFSPHKNIVNLVRAFDLVLDEHPLAVLVLAGDTEGDPFLSSTADVRAAVSSMRHRNSVIVTGFVSDDDLVHLYQGAVATVLVSLGEGFGLPVAESLACGTPVVASDIPALRELAGEAGRYVDPGDEVQIAEGMAELLADPALRDRMAKVGIARAASLSWARAADTVLGLLEEVGSR